MKWITTPFTFGSSRAHHPQKSWSRMISTHLFFSQCLLGLAHVHRLSLRKSRGMTPSRLGWCGKGAEALSSLPRRLCPCRAILIPPRLFLPAHRFWSWNLGLILLWPWSWAHLLQTLLCLWARGFGTQKIFLQWLTSTVSNLWLHYLLLELILLLLLLIWSISSKDLLWGSGVDFLFSCCLW